MPEAARICSLHFKGAEGPKPWWKLPDRSKGLSAKCGLKARKRLCLEKGSDGSGVVDIYNFTKFDVLNVAIFEKFVNFKLPETVHVFVLAKVTTSNTR